MAQVERSQPKPYQTTPQCASIIMVSMVYGCLNVNPARFAM